MKRIFNNVKGRIVLGGKNMKVTERNSVLKEMNEQEEKFDEKMFEAKFATLKELRKAKKEGKKVDSNEILSNKLVEVCKKEKEIVKETNVKENNNKEEIISEENINKTVNEKDKNVKRFSRTEMKEKSNESSQLSLIDAIDRMKDYANGEREVQLTDDGFVMYESWDDYMRANDDSEQPIDSWVEN